MEHNWVSWYIPDEVSEMSESIQDQGSLLGDLPLIADAWPAIDAAEIRTTQMSPA